MVGKAANDLTEAVVAGDSDAAPTLYRSEGARAQSKPKPKFAGFGSDALGQPAHMPIIS